MTNKIYLLLMTLVISSGFTAHAGNSDATVEKLSSDSVSVSGLRNQRYCEVLYGNRSFLTLELKVFSTEGLNECPEDAWKLVTDKTITNAHPASFVRLNGPRYWTIDGIQATGATVNHVRESFGGIEMNLRALQVQLLSRTWALCSLQFFEIICLHPSLTQALAMG
ncbi:hypothetical protein G6715_04590 [Polynucleobacter paneuropaeus]|nr:hypothetical protein [Polynucleobacter paneuropaeus]